MASKKSRSFVIYSFIDHKVATIFKRTKLHFRAHAAILHFKTSLRTSLRGLMSAKPEGPNARILLSANTRELVSKRPKGRGKTVVQDVIEG